MVFEALNKSKTFENKKREERNLFKQKLENSWNGNILHCFNIFAINPCTNVRLTWFMQSQKEESKIYNFVVYHKFRKKKKCFGGQKWSRSLRWIKSRDSHLKFEGFSLFLLEEAKVIGEEKSRTFFIFCFIFLYV